MKIPKFQNSDKDVLNDLSLAIKYNPRNIDAYIYRGIFQQITK